VRRLRWLMAYLRKALGASGGRALLSAGCTALAVAVVLLSAGLYLGLREQLARELRAYGANAILSPRSGQYLDVQAVRQALAQEEGVLQAHWQLYGRVLLINAVSSGRQRLFSPPQELELIGLEPEKLQGYRLKGMLPQGGQVAVGEALAEALGISVGMTLGLSSEASAGSYWVSGVLQSGGPEDKALLMGLEDAQLLLGLRGRASAVLLRVAPGLRLQLPEAEFRSLRQVAAPEEQFLGKMQLLMLLVALVVLFCASLGLLSAQASGVLERLRDIGLMRALGGGKGQITLLFAAEALLAGLAGAALGFVLALGGALVVAKGAFGVYVLLPLWLLFPGLALGAALSVGAGLLPLRAALGLAPAAVLRGE